MRFPKLSLRPAGRPAFAAPSGTAPGPKLILHAGSQKTGTTTIQYALSQARDHLAAHRISYPPISAHFPVDPQLASARAHFAFVTAVARFAPADQTHLARFVAALQDGADACDKVILSAESIYRHTARAAPQPGKAAPVSRTGFLDRLAMVTQGFDTEILLYLRRVDRYAASLYAESIVTSHHAWSFPAFLNAKRARFDYRGQIDRFKAHFPVRVRSYEAAAKTGLVRAFCADTGIPGDLPVPEERRRASVPNTAVLWLRQVKRQQGRLSDVERGRRWHFALRPEHAGLFETDGPTVFWKDQAMRDGFIETHQAGVSEVALPRPESGIARKARWPDARHAEAERQFQAWQAANAKALRKRERKRIPPYVLDP